MLRLKGVIPALVTPVKKDETIDVNGTIRLVDHLLQKGVSSIFALGVMGEFATLQDKEKRRLLEAVVTHTNGKVPVLAGVSDTGTKRVIKNALLAYKIGADAIVALPPFFEFMPQQKPILDFYREVADKSKIPLVIYHNPVMAKVKIELDTVTELSQHQNIIGVKDSSGDFAFLCQILKIAKSGSFFVLTGDEKKLADGVEAGANGIVTGVGNIAISIFIELYMAAKNGHKERARKLQDNVNKLLEFCQDSWIQAIKYGLKLLVICDDNVCKPYCPVDEETRQKVKVTLESIGILRKQ